MAIKYNMYSELLKALSHPTRIAILELLKSEDQLCVCVINEALNLEQSNISQHLKVLKNCGILTSHKEGLKVMYQVVYPEVYDILALCNKILLEQHKSQAGGLL